MTTSTSTSISVVICVFTDERWDDILAAVSSVRAQRYQPHEIIVSVDHNPDLFAKLSAALPDVVVIENQESRGLSGGKNTGAARASGDVVAYLDDDAVADRDWLAFFAAGYADPRVLGVGGRTLSLWPGSPTAREIHADQEALLREHTEVGVRPRWFPQEFDWTVGGTYKGMVAGPVRNVLGGNASFRRQAFEIAGGFHTGIGRSHHKNRPLGCEETEFCIRLGQRSPGAVMLFDDRAVIWHRVPAERARFRYFRTRCFAEGLSKALVARSVGTGDGLANERAHALKTLPRGAVRGVGDTLRGDPSGLGRAGAITLGLGYTAWGYAVGSLSARRPRTRDLTPAATHPRDVRPGPTHPQDAPSQDAPPQTTWPQDTRPQDTE
jgi:glycosyltransferase involved in cell wall biosynthesis